MQNLIENAAKFMGDQKEPLIEIGALEKGGETFCYVQDNGIGIDPRYHEKIFDLFDKLDQNMPGTGVGLAIVKRIIEIHKGRIWVESEGRGQGSTFYFSIPGVSTQL
jgi:signal transduction histidine kinase